MSRSKIVTLLSDFGLRDPYVAEMKAVILSICPDVTIVDISHEIRKFDVRMGAFILAQATPYFPDKTVHLAVVDPGVGTKRRPMVVETKRSLYVGPDNGLLMLSAKTEEVNCIYEIINPKYMLKNISTTFHGRDVFSPAAAHLANGVPPSYFGPEIHNPVIPSFAKPVSQNKEMRGEVIHIDSFGNVITNITMKDITQLNIKKGETLLVRLKSKDVVLRFCIAYGEVPPNTPLAVIGSSGFLEVSVNQGDASRVFNVQLGDAVVLRAPSTFSEVNVRC